MEVFAAELCTCYLERQEFQKLVELKDNGLVVYCHRTCTDNVRQGQVVESALNTSRDVFILHNKKDVKITTSQLTSELEKKNINCPRCRKIFEHAQELIKEVKSIDKKIIMSICDHCRKRAPGNKKMVCACEKIVNLFKTVKGEQTEDTKKCIKVLTPETSHLRKKKEKNVQIYQDIHSPAARHEPEIQQMFYSDTHFQSNDTDMSETESKDVCIKQTVSLIESIKTMQKSVVHTPHEVKINTKTPVMSLVDSDTTFVETYEYVGVTKLPRSSITKLNQEKIFEDTPSIDAKEELKRRHDISLRQMVKLEKDSQAPFFILKRPDVYETPKTAPWVQKEPTPKYHVEPKHDRDSQNLDYVSNRLVQFGSSRNIQDFEESKLDKYHHDKMKKGLYDSDRYLSNAKLSRSVEKVKKSVQNVAKSKSVPVTSVGNFLKPQFSFFFPKEEEKKEKHINLDVSSSQLIKDTQEKIRLESEGLKKRKEEERKQKLAREEKKRKADEKKKWLMQRQKKMRKSNKYWLKEKKPW